MPARHRNVNITGQITRYSLKRTIQKWMPAASVLALLLAGSTVLSTLLIERTSRTIGGPYTLIDTQGHDVTQARFQGHYTLIYFGYTHCIDVCPLTLATVSQALDVLGQSGVRIIPVFITVDPARDTPKVVGDYVSHFSPEIVGLTGSTAQVHSVVDEFQVMIHRRNIPTDHIQNDYLMDHSSVLYLMDGHNRLVSILPVDVSPQEIAARLRHLLPTS